jgi:predicted ATPase
LLLDGRAEEGLQVVREAQATCQELGEAVHEAEVQRTLGDLLLGLPHPKTDEAESVYRHSIEVARGQQARSYELRATVSLARLLQSQGRNAEARDMLQTIYGWFTEGFDTGDLREAKALLDELGSGSRIA